MSDLIPGSRRTLLKRAGLAAAGFAAAAPVVGSASASAAGTQPAYTDAPNTFTADQSVMARLGVGTTSPQAPLHLVRPDAGPALRIDAHTMALVARHDTDWAGQTYDLVNLYHRSTGDAMFIVHQGGKPPGFTGTTGADAALNVLVPYHLDDTTTGRNGTVVNDRTGMRGLFIQTQPNNDNINAIRVAHWGNDYAAYFTVQTTTSGEPTGKGGGLLMDDFSTSSSIRINKRNAPRANEAMVVLRTMITTPFEAIRITDNNGFDRLRATTDGTLAIYDGGGGPRFMAKPDGTMSVGSNIRFPGVVFQAHAIQKGVARSAALVNRDPNTGSGTQIEFDDATMQYALLRVGYDNRTAGARSASMRFSVRAADALTERLRLDGTGIGFFGATPVARPTVGGSRQGNDALTNLLHALDAMGLVKDTTT